MRLQNDIRQKTNLFKKRLLSSFLLSFLNIKKTAVMKALTRYSFKNYNKRDSL